MNFAHSESFGNVTDKHRADLPAKTGPSKRNEERQMHALQ